MYPKDLKYTEEHEWVRVEDGVATVGITHYAQEQLGDIVFVELPEVGQRLEKGESFGVVESVKTVSDLYSPVSGTVTAINEELLDAPEKVNEDPYGAGWMIKLELADEGELAELLDAAEYTRMLEEEG